MPAEAVGEKQDEDLALSQLEPRVSWSPESAGAPFVVQAVWTRDPVGRCAEGRKATSTEVRSQPPPTIG